MYFSVLLPVLNERENLETLLTEIEKVFVGLGKSFEVIVVDDGSTDGSAEFLAESIKTRPYLKVIVFRKNRGQTAAFDAGFRAAQGQIIITMDSDLQNDPNDIPKMLALIEQGYDFVSGWRKNRQDGFWLRTFPSKIANRIIRKVTGTKLHDMGCSLKVYRKEITDELKLYGEMHRFIAVLCEDAGAKVGEIVVNHRPRVAGVSKYNLSRTMKVVLDLITVWFLRSYQTKPIYLFGGIGMGLLGSSFFLALVILWQKFYLDSWVHKNPLFIIMILCIVVGVLFIMMGLIAELLIRTYFEISEVRPYSVLKRLGFESKSNDSSRPMNGHL